MKMSLRILALCAAASSASAFAATPLTLLAPGTHDQVPTQIAALQAKSLAANVLDHTPVHVSRALNPAQSLAAPQPFVAHSREFWSDVGQTELRAGMQLTTSAPGALIRFSPEDGAAAALDPAGILIRHNGRTLNANTASMAVADSKALRSAGMEMPAGSLAFRLAPASGSGAMEIAAAHAQGRYLVHVFEPHSPLVMNLRADRDTVLVGHSIHFHASLSNAGAAAKLALVSGLVHAPDGYSADLHFTRDADGSFDATFSPNAAHNVGPQLWEAQVFTASRHHGLVVRRDGKTAFAVSAPTAQFSGSAQLTNDATGMHIALGIAAASTSRYQVSAVLYGSGSDGSMHPLALAQSAAWLTAGQASVELDFDSAALQTNGLHAPYELRDLRLVDQATMAVIERRERALTVD